ncbi:protein Daple-like [Myotis daubentonii]|uniref:protein Daple-like n=1 Tax=Myotis daubentonii TaxID=98922 RepID=UPI00287318B7|nr:protein Daple-like [Myotis daubentonii]
MGRIPELGSLACTRITDLEENTHALQGTVKMLQEENQQLRKEVEELGTQLTQDKANSQKEELEGEPQSNIANTMRPSRATQEEEPSSLGPQNQQGAAEREPGEQEKQLPEVQESLRQEQEAKALAPPERTTERRGCSRSFKEAGSAPEPWAVWLSARRLTSWTELLQGEQEELRTQTQELQASLEDAQRKMRIWQAAYRDLKAEQRPKEILLTKLSIQCESLTRVKKDWQEEKRHLRREIDTLKELNESLLDACEEHCTENIESRKTMPTGEAEEDRSGDPKEAQCPAPRKKKRWSRARAFLKFFQRQRDGSRGQAKSPADSLPGPLEATPWCSYWEEKGDARSGPPPKGRRGWPGCRRAVKGRISGLPRGQGRTDEMRAGCAHVCLEPEGGSARPVCPLRCVNTQVEHVSPRHCGGSFIQNHLVPSA